MGKKDLAAKKLEAYNDVFADIFNTLLFKSDEMIPMQLKAGPTESIYKAAGRQENEEESSKEQRRDTLKEYRDSERYIIMAYGIENQMKCDRTMPVRVMGYDYGTYRQQLMENRWPLYPAVTVVLNFSNERWTRNKSLHEIMNVSEKQKGYIQDYRITVFDIAYLEDETIEKFRSDFKHVAQFFKCRRLNDKDALKRNKMHIKHAEAFAELLSVFTGDKRYEDEIPYIRKEEAEGRKISMCWIMDSERQEGIEQGIKQGVTMAVKMLFKNGASMELVAASIPQLTPERLRELQQEALTEKESNS